MKISTLIVLTLITVLICSGVLFILNLLGFTPIINTTISFLVTINCVMWMMTVIDLSESHLESSIVSTFESELNKMKQKGWDKIYVFVDIHGTMIYPNYQAGNIPTQFYENAVDTLQLFSKRSDVCLILYTCSHPHEIEQYLKLFKDNDIHFEYVNENPEVKTQLNGYGCYDKKPYMNLLLEDKAGFVPERDWVLLKEYLENNQPSKAVFTTRTDEEIKESRNSAKNYLI